MILLGLMLKGCIGCTFFYYFIIYKTYFFLYIVFFILKNLNSTKYPTTPTTLQPRKT